MPQSIRPESLTFDTDTPEVYWLGLVRIDVRAAKRILAAKLRKPRIYQCQLNDIAHFVRQPELHKRADGTIVVSCGAQKIDWTRIRSPEIDLSVPLLLARLPRNLGGLWPIDGWHRIAKAIDNQLTSLPCFVLSAKDSLQIIDYPDN